MRPSNFRGGEPRTNIRKILGFVNTKSAAPSPLVTVRRRRSPPGSFGQTQTCRPCSSRHPERSPQPPVRLVKTKFAAPAPFVAAASPAGSPGTQVQLPEHNPLPGTARDQSGRLLRWAGSPAAAASAEWGETNIAAPGPPTCSVCLGAACPA